MLSVLIVLKHRGNIMRLIAGTEAEIRRRWLQASRLPHRNLEAYYLGQD
jgi:hypothetical protein